MKYRLIAWMLSTLPLAAAGQEAANRPASVPLADPQAFHLKGQKVQGLLRTSVAAPSAPAAPSAQQERPALTETELANEKLKRIDFAAARTVTRYREADDALRKIYRQQMRDQTIVTSADSFDAWLSCQDTNNLLSTFERFDRCQSVKLELHLDRVTANDEGLPSLPR